MSAVENLVSPCGLHCGVCPLYRAGEDPDLARRIAANFKMDPAEVPCPGCRPAAGQPPVMRGKRCDTYACIESRGHRFCSQCEAFPCLNLAPCAYRAESLPHNTKIYNLLLIRKEGLDNWAERVAERNRQYFKGVKKDGGAPIQIPVEFQDS